MGAASAPLAVTRHHSRGTNWSPLNGGALLTLVVMLAALGLSGALIIVSPETVWRRVDPIGYAMAQLRHADFFTAPYRNDIGGIEEPIPAWRAIVRSPVAESLLGELAHERAPVPRLYALAGLSALDYTDSASQALVTALASTLATDSSLIPVNFRCSEGSTRGRVAAVAPIARSRPFVEMLLRGGHGCP